MNLCKCTSLNISLKIENLCSRFATQERATFTLPRRNGYASCGLSRSTRVGCGFHPRLQAVGIPHVEGPLHFRIPWRFASSNDPRSARIPECVSSPRAYDPDGSERRRCLLGYKRVLLGSLTLHSSFFVIPPFTSSIFHQLTMHKFFAFFFACVLLFTVVSATPAPVIADVENRDSEFSLVKHCSFSSRNLSYW
jgi:hypothetical protein